MSAKPLVIHLCSWPGAGKRTIGKVLATRIGGRLIDNHVIANPASALYDRRSARHLTLRQQVQQLVFDHALRLPSEVPLVFTDALADQEADRAIFAPLLDFIARRDARFCPVTLILGAEENRRRLIDPTRAPFGKLTDPAVLDRLRDAHTLLRPEGAVSLAVDGLSPDAAAAAIMALCDLNPAEGARDG